MEAILSPPVSIVKVCLNYRPVEPHRISIVTCWVLAPTLLLTPVLYTTTGHHPAEDLLIISLISFFHAELSSLHYRQRKKRGTQQEIRKANASLLSSIPLSFNLLSLGGSYSGNHNDQGYVKAVLSFLKKQVFLFPRIMSITCCTIPSRNSPMPFNVDKKHFHSTST